MAVENLIDKLETIVSKEKSTWHEKSKYRAENRDWLKKSQAIAIKVNGIIRERGITQKDLADLLKVSPQHVNKIIKGQENLTLQTISRLESALGITLIIFAKNTTNVHYVSNQYFGQVHQSNNEFLNIKSKLSEMNAKYIQAPKEAKRYKLCA